MIVDKVVGLVVKLIAKQFKLEKILAYVEGENELDKKCSDIEKRLDMLEKLAHPKKDFVLCKKCENVIKQYEGTD